MIKGHARAVRIFYSYAHRDKELRDELANHLGRSHIAGWHDREILAGQDWEKEIDIYLETADIILLLISANFLSSRYCSGKEMRRALERQEAGDAEVIPIILRPVYWKEEPFKHLQILPRNEKPVTRWSDSDEAFMEVAEGIRGSIKNVLKKRYIVDAETATTAGQHEDARDAYEQITRLFPDDPIFYERLGNTLLRLQRFDEAVQTITKAINLDQHNASFYVSKARVLVQQKQWGNALAVYKQAMELNVRDFSACQEMGDVLSELGNFQEALSAYEKAIHLSPLKAPQLFQLYMSKAKIFTLLEQNSDALLAYEKARQLQPRNAQLHVLMGTLLASDGQYRDALDAYEKAIELEPDNAQFWRRKGLLHVSLEQYEEALLAYEEVIQIENDNPHFYKENGDILFKLELFQEALTAYQDATRLQPDFGLAYECQGNAYEKLAEQAYDRYMRLAMQAREKANELDKTPKRRKRK